MSLNEYKNWFNNSHLEWEKLKDEKKLYKQQSSYKYTEETAEDYVKKRCLECNCNYEDLKTVHEIKHNKIILLDELVSIAKYDIINSDSIIKKTTIYLWSK